MTYQAHLETDADTKPKTPWKYKIAYGIMAWVIAASLNNALGVLIFIGLIVLYPFMMSLLASNRFSFFANERTYLKDEWKTLPVWGKAMVFAAIFTLLPFSVGVNPVSDFISLTFLFCIMGYPIAFVLRQIRDTTARAKDQL